jgi:hypothetical protein
VVLVADGAGFVTTASSRVVDVVVVEGELQDVTMQAAIVRAGRRIISFFIFVVGWFLPQFAQLALVSRIGGEVFRAQAIGTSRLSKLDA